MGSHKPWGKTMKHLITAALTTAALAYGYPAGAANYIAISGSEVDFYYDVDLWGAGAASVSGNTISFAINQSQSYQNDDEYSGGGVGVGLEGRLGVIAVAHSGYLVNNNLGTSPNASAYSNRDDWTTSGSTAITFVTEYAAGTFSGGSFTSQGQFAEYFFWSQNSYGEYYNNSNYYDQLIIYGDQQAKYSAVGLDIYLGAGAMINGRGSIGASLSGASYSFDVSPAPVPEPAAWLSLGAGLAALALVSQRRRRHA